MKEKVFLFPGVGSHHVGMGKEFYENFKTARDIFEEAGDVLGLDLARLCFNPAEKSKLDRLEISQSALVTVSMAIYRVYAQEIGDMPAHCMGHSLGEYSALCSAGVIRFADTIEIVKQRGIILNEAAAAVDGLMAWVINLDNKVVEQRCREYSEEAREVYVSAYDAPAQSSISGLKQDVIKVGRILEKDGAIVYPLKLSGPFHSPFMKKAAHHIRSLLGQYEYGEPLFPVIANRSALFYEADKENIIDNLSLQLVSPILWQHSVEYMVGRRIETAIEMGPDKVLKHLLKNNTLSIRTYSLENTKDLELLRNSLK
jgi:[acyl-carrier-protein] S-malonyltransferase